MDTEEAIADFKALMAEPAARAAFVELKAQKDQEGVGVRYQHILRAVFETPWAIRPSMLAVIVDLLAFRSSGGRFDAAEIAERIGARRPPASEGPAGVAVIPLHGVIIPKAGGFSEISGGTSIERFRAAFREAMARSDVKALVIDVDSPGGMVDQVPEMASEIRAARGQKPIVAVANTQAASAAYWLASQADEVVVTKSARVGSIGVITAHEDESKKAELAGVKTTLISAGKFKTEGNPFEPLSIEAREYVQSMVDGYYAMFVSDVARGRGAPIDAVRAGFGQGRMVGASDAVALGMADRVGTLETVIQASLSERVAAAEAVDAVIEAAEHAPIAPIEAIWSELRERQDRERAEAEDEARYFVSAAGLDPASFMAAVDNSSWDGNRAMGMCSGAADYRAICAGEHNAGEPDQRQHWALPHHYLEGPGSARGPNADGVRNALARLPQTQDLANRERAQSHLDAHMQEINPSASSAKSLGDETGEVDMRIGLLRDDPSAAPFK